ncbi:unnamed protein product [Spirodela intermedia]|uniref:EF-hand domain-containing protein n=1 Tax=Spirodela intermedia TaxID=51605 RepID=A0A7I8KJ75_SPIIN|nr:unnamed protein product [Spirodela intermedia]
MARASELSPGDGSRSRQRSPSSAASFAAGGGAVVHGAVSTGSLLRHLRRVFSPKKRPSSPSTEEEARKAPVSPPQTSADFSIDDGRANEITETPQSPLENYVRVFRYFDQNGDGKVSPSELRNCMRKVGEELSEKDAEAVVGSTDSDGDGLLGYADFVSLVAVGREEEEDGDLREVFSMYEMKGEGCITAESLRRMLRRLGDYKTVDECKVMIRRYDLDGDGVLSFEEFKVMML